MALKIDVLIIGSGIERLFAELKISEYADVIVVTKKNTSESNTNYLTTPRVGSHQLSIKKILLRNTSRML